jgi:hypothetical protein
MLFGNLPLCGIFYLYARVVHGVLSCLTLLRQTCCAPLFYFLHHLVLTLLSLVMDVPLPFCHLSWPSFVGRLNLLCFELC